MLLKRFEVCVTGFVQVMSTWVNFSKSVSRYILVAVTQGGLISIHSGASDFAFGANTYKLPSRNTPLGAIFCALGRCRSQIIGNSRASNIPSITEFWDCLSQEEGPNIDARSHHRFSLSEIMDRCVFGMTTNWRIIHQTKTTTAIAWSDRRNRIF